MGVLEVLDPVFLDQYIWGQYCRQLLLNCLRPLCNASKPQFDVRGGNVKQLLLRERRAALLVQHSIWLIVCCGGDNGCCQGVCNARHHAADRPCLVVAGDVAVVLLLLLLMHCVPLLCMPAGECVADASLRATWLLDPQSLCQMHGSLGEREMAP